MQPYIRLEVFRHDEKDLAEKDELAPLTEKGRLGALVSGRKKGAKLYQGHVVASPRQRAIHSAMLQFVAPHFTGLDLHKYTFEEAMEFLRKQENSTGGKKLDLHKKISTDQRLDFHVESHPVFYQRFYEEYNREEGNRTLQFQLEESDELILDLAKKVRDFHSDEAEGLRRVKGFKRMAGDLAEVILEYFDKYWEWEEGYKKSPQAFEDGEMQVFIGTHSQNIECFLLSLLLFKEGKKSVEEFLSGLKHGKSFIDYSQGFTLLLRLTDQGEFLAELLWRGEKFFLTKKDFQSMVYERDAFNHEVEKKLLEDSQA